jgi:multisubunit Na+/H+ antiporter MnhG subunit
MRGTFLNRLPGLLPLAMGLGLLSMPWWATSVPAKLHPVLMVFGAAFAGFGCSVLIPDRWPRLQSLSVMVYMGAFGLVMAAMAFAPLHADPDGTYTIAGISGLRTSTTHSLGAFSTSSTGGDMPWWARIVAGFFMVICLGIAVLAAWGVVRPSSRPDTYDDD